MSGLEILMHLLLASGAVHQCVGTRCFPVVVPQGQSAPAITVRSISRLPRNTLGLAEANVHVRERLQVTAVCGRDDYPQLPALRRAVLQACASQRLAALGDASRIVVLADAAGPELFDDEVGLYVAPQDFLVSWQEAQPT